MEIYHSKSESLLPSVSEVIFPPICLIIVLIFLVDMGCVGFRTYPGWELKYDRRFCCSSLVLFAPAGLPSFLSFTLFDVAIALVQNADVHDLLERAVNRELYSSI